MKKILISIATIVVVIVIGAGVVNFLNSRDQSPFPAGPNDGGQDLGQDDQVPAQPEHCPSIEVISAPGTWESAADDDPMNPQANPRSFMLSITNPLRETYAPDDVKVWTLPYTAQFRNINAQNELSYDDSRNEGTDRLNEELRFMNESCPQTKFFLTGFSQGAVIVGDIIDEIGGGTGMVPADKILGSVLIADGRREPGVGINPGVELEGIGAEIALQPVSGLVQPIVPGATMRGARPNGFGELADRTYTICSPADSICDAPRGIGNALDRAFELIGANGIHAQYATNGAVIPGTTANAWTEGYIRKVIEDNR